MKKRSLLFFVILLFIASPVSARIGLGIIVGEPTGISLRVNHFPVLGLQWSTRNDHMLINADYWIVHQKLESPLYWYFGAGPGLSIGNSSYSLKARFPLGLQWAIHRDWEIFGELVPGLVILPETDPDLGGGIGIRYLF